MIKTILGLDVSSSTIGWCILKINDLTKDIKYVDSGFIKPIKTGAITERIINTRDKITKIINNFLPDYIGIEDLIKFMPKSTATTVVMLTTFNRMVCVASYDFLKKSPQLFNVMSIRHGLKINKKLPKKEDMPELVAKHLGITFPYVYNTKGKKKGTIKVESGDIADGIAVALYYAFILTGKIKKKPIKQNTE